MKEFLLTNNLRKKTTKGLVIKLGTGAIGELLSSNNKNKWPRASQNLSYSQWKRVLIHDAHN